jgi:hypothetical protein
MRRFRVSLKSAEDRCEFLLTQKRSRQPGSAWLPGGIFAGASGSGLGPQSMRARLLRLLVRPTPPSRWESPLGRFSSWPRPSSCFADGIGAGGLYACCALLLVAMALAIRLVGPLTNNQQLDTI